MGVLVISLLALVYAILVAPYEQRRLLRNQILAVASAIGGAAVSFVMLVAARALQGAFGALRTAIQSPSAPLRVSLDRTGAAPQTRRPPRRSQR